MNRIIKYSFILLVFISLNGCKYYNFTGTGKIDAETFQVNYFQNNSELIEPGLDRDFTLALQDLIQTQTNLNLTNSGADLIYEGEITGFRITPMSATADQRAAQNRVTMTVNVRYTNTKKEEDDFEKTFSYFYDYPANEQLVGTRLNIAKEELFERITQDIFNASLARW